MAKAEVLMQKQSLLSEDLARAIVNFRKTGQTKRTASYYKRVHQKLAGLQVEYANNHQLLHELAAEDPNVRQFPYFAERLSNDFEETLFLFQGELDDLLHLTVQQASEASSGCDMKAARGCEKQREDWDVRLPRIEIPRFSGSYTDWVSFRDLFCSLVHDKVVLPKPQKMQYLMCSLVGEPHDLLRGFPISDGGYDQAWKLLQDRYNNKGMLLSAQFRKLFALPSAIETASYIKDLADEATKRVQAITLLEIPNLWESVVVYLISQRLPIASRQLWEQRQLVADEMPTFEDIKNFLVGRFRVLEASGCDDTKPFRKPLSPGRNKQVYHVQSVPECGICSQPHHLRKCTIFKGWNIEKRRDFVRNKSLCFNCLSSGHQASKCNSRFRCNRCNQAHHSLLHLASRRPSLEQNQNLSSSKLSAQAPSFNHTELLPGIDQRLLRAPAMQSHATQVNTMEPKGTKQVLLATAMITIKAPVGNIKLRALLDQASEICLITESAVQRLGLRKQKIETNVIGVGNGVSRVRSAVQFQVLDPHSLANVLTVEAVVIDKITGLVPSQPVAVNQWTFLKEVQLADPSFDRPGHIDVLLGVEEYTRILLNEKRMLGTRTMLQETLFGWVLSGSAQVSNDAVCHLTRAEVSTNQALSDQLKQFWELEEVGSATKPFSIEDQAAIQHFNDHTSRGNDGSYTVRLPFKSQDAPLMLGDSKTTALSSLIQCEKRLSTNPELRTSYNECMDEYVKMGHMQEVAAADGGYFLPHHAVLKESTTTKLRVVFDASRKTSCGHALNDILLTGPKLQRDLISILLNWRQFRYAFVADISKMYRRIHVNHADQRYQKILWRNRPDEEIREYALSTVTFGLTCAPFLAINTLHRLANDERENYPEATMAIQSEFYVDDLLSGGQDLVKTISKRRSIQKVLDLGGFPLHKWISNDDRILADVDPEQRESHTTAHIDQEQSYKSLGILWYPERDYLSFQMNRFPQHSSGTKRSILSEIARLYDPLGLLAPSIVLAKILLQALWQRGKNWDEPVPPDIQRRWLQLQGQLNYFAKIRIPRWVPVTEEWIVELHGFCDASQTAYAAAVYAVSRSQKGCYSRLLGAKSKVAPIHPATIPRLELCGAVLLAKLIHKIKTESAWAHIDTRLWSDSQIVLAWLQGHPSRWAVFVANRITQIFELVGNTVWQHVPSKENPADLATRGLLPAELVDHPLWWTGPPWLLTMEWPKKEDILRTNLEARKHAVISNHVLQSTLLDELSNKFSSFTRLLRITAYCLRVRRQERSQKTHSLHLSPSELEHAEAIWIQYAQQLEFSHDLASLAAGKSLPKKSKLLNLNPFVDAKGVLRVGGRLSHSSMPFPERHPVILPKHGRIVELLLDRIHQITFHGETQLMLSTLRQRYWILDGRNVVKHFIHKCVTCFRTKAKASAQLMGELPAPRVTLSRPFAHTGVDYCGPFYVKAKRGRGTPTFKGYVAVFICLSVKAIHLELVGDLTTKAFLAALKRFVGRRGRCEHLYSDCGTNFAGADVELKRAWKNNQSAAGSLATDGIKWHFNPPASLHFGGLWEAGVKSLKRHLRKVIGESRLTIEEFNTVLIQIEACLNSRPLCPLTDDPTDLDALTPAHFLVGGPLVALPENNVLELKCNTLDRWQYSQKLSQTFAQRWTREYIARLQQRPKWLRRTENLKIGDLCLVKDEQLPPYKWPLGRITALHPGKDALVRVVSVQIKGTVYKRPTVKIAPLPINHATI